MCTKMDNIDIYNNSAIILNKNTPKSVVSWITILIILLVLLIIFFSIPFNIYRNYVSYVVLDENVSYIRLSSFKVSDFPINVEDKLYIKGQYYNYDVVSINESEVILKVELEDEIKIDNNIVIVNMLRDRTTVFEILKNKIKKGFGL